jgi:hypothetical protein
MLGEFPSWVRKLKFSGPSSPRKEVGSLLAPRRMISKFGPQHGFCAPTFLKGCYGRSTISKPASSNRV